jgi:acrylyl-CoA reductase (NADPH)/3-hydroxypropionyl-CoA dehydratase/3-hydroxypropionyl-CoA synthetase
MEQQSVPRPISNLLASAAEWEAQRATAVADPGRFHGRIAKREIHWYDATADAWIVWDDARSGWTGWSASSAGPIDNLSYDETHEPWQRAFNADHAPLYRWFEGGLTNACFNEVDRHVLAGRGDERAFIWEGDRWDPSRNNGRGGPVSEQHVSRKQLLLEVVKAAEVLRSLGLQQGDRIALNLPNILQQIFYTEAAKRLGIIYTPVFGGFSDKTLSDRIADAGAKVVITSDGAYRNAQIVPFKEVYTDRALDGYLPVPAALAVVQTEVERLALEAEQSEAIVDAVKAAVQGEITVERADVMRGVGLALHQLPGIDPATAAHIRTAIAQALVAAGPQVETVIVVRHTGQADLNWRSERDRWSHELLADALERILENARAAGYHVTSEADLLQLPTEDFVRALWATSRPLPVAADWPLFIIYTSGSTGKPKGVVHVHGGYVAGLAHTMKIAFDVRPGDVMYVIADPGWITGQSYMISAALTTATTSVVAEASPLFPNAGRYASIIERNKVTIFKAGSTFLKSVMTDPQNIADVRHYDMSSLRVATFCAEPTSPSVQQFGMQLMTPQYINSYWATEHGGIVWTHMYGNPDFPLRPDAHTYPLPWIGADVWVAESTTDGLAETNDPLALTYRTADFGEKGEIVVTLPYPYLARTIWGDADNVGSPGWRGDVERWTRTYFHRHQDGTLAYVQGDFAIKYPDGSFSLHGRSDDVINVSGHRIGTEEIEGAILRDKQIMPDSPVGNVIVVGAPHREKGLTPVAFVLPVPGRKFTADDRRRLETLVRTEKGALAVPSDFVEVPAFPETRSGKYMRRFLRNLMLDEPLGDTTTLRNPESIDDLQVRIDEWKRRQAVAEGQQFLERWRYFRVEYYPVTPEARIALVTVDNPPVNALNERALDELNTLVEHLARRDDVKVVVFTGAGKNFVAGADIKQLLDDMHTVDDALPLPRKAHRAFRAIEMMDKPCIAAINGACLGGGLEFALACHYRIAEPGVAYGFPEIGLNLLPGYGGTQRLPRLVATDNFLLAQSVALLLSGRRVVANGTDQDPLGVMNLFAQNSGGAVASAVEAARAYITGVDGCLAEVVNKRRRQVEEWEQPQPLAWAELEQDTELQRIIASQRAAGRGKAVERVLEAVRYGYEHGYFPGLAHEAELFAQAVVDPEGGKHGIRAFLDKQSAPLPTRSRPSPTPNELLPVGAPFFPGVTPIPCYQHAYAVIKSPDTGKAMHGDPATAEVEITMPVQQPSPNDALVYVLASEINFNDIWAITGVPVSQFDSHDEDWHISGSGGVGLIAALGDAARQEGRLKVGDLVVIFSGQSDLLSPLQGLDPMFADFHIQGYETPDGSHQQFVLVQAPQCLPVPADLTLEQAGSYMLNLGTIYRGLFTTLGIEAGRRLFVEGAATGTGMEAAKVAARNGLHVTGMVSSAERAAVVKEIGARSTINRRDERYRGIWTRVPADPAQWKVWEQAGQPLLDDFRAQNDGQLADYAVSHAGEVAFPRSFQLLGEPHDGHVPTLTFYGASSGYHFTFIGKPGAEQPSTMLRRARLRANEAVLIYYGPEQAELLDARGLELIEAGLAAGARIVVATYTDAQREFVLSLGYGAQVKGVVSIESIKRREGDDFIWPATMPELPDPLRDTEAFKQAVREFNDLIFKPFGTAVGGLLRSPDNPRGYPDLILERADHDALSVSVTLVKPFTGRVVFCEDLAGRRFSFYAPQVWMRQRRVYMPSANIWGTHLNNAYEAMQLNDLITAGVLEVTEPLVVDWHDQPHAHQAMWENRHAGATYVANHALPFLGIKTKDELFEAWAMQLGR